MYRPELIAKFPREVQDLAKRGTYSLFVSKLDNTLLARISKSDCFRFDSNGTYLSSISSANVDFDDYEQIDVVSGEQLNGLIKASV